ncbi:hypothetical protein EZS27_025222 [termite gut metagenome]|uniref:Gluconate 2-dehydrogenase subunit 3 family protein n=1 Tax=termite gut metagenome TaxID=433724 RepID=A0A5J4QXG2_9ZZZZ
MKSLVLLYGSVLFFSACKREKDAYLRSFTREQSDCLAALCEQVIPADDAPGATDAGVVYYIDTVVSLHFPELRDTYQKGISALQASCRALYNSPFESLSSEKQIAVMKQMENQTLPEEYWKEISSGSFMEMIVRHTMQGFYGSPRHGGNKDYVSYRMLKLDYPLLIGQNRYRHG